MEISHRKREIYDVLEINHSYRHEFLEMMKKNGTQSTHEKKIDLNRPIYFLIFTRRKETMVFQEQIVLQIG